MLINYTLLLQLQANYIVYTKLTALSHGIISPSDALSIIDAAMDSDSTDS